MVNLINGLSQPALLAHESTPYNKHKSLPAFKLKMAETSNSDSSDSEPVTKLPRTLAYRKGKATRSQVSRSADNMDRQRLSRSHGRLEECGTSANQNIADIVQKLRKKRETNRGNGSGSPSPPSRQVSRSPDHWRRTSVSPPPRGQDSRIPSPRTSPWRGAGSSPSPPRKSRYLSTSPVTAESPNRNPETTRDSFLRKPVITIERLEYGIKVCQNGVTRIFYRATMAEVSDMLKKGIPRS